MYLCRRALRKTPAPPPRLNVGQLVDQMTPEQIREINGQLVHYQIKQKSTFPSEGQRLRHHQTETHHLGSHCLTLIMRI